MDRVLRPRDELAVEHGIEAVVLRDGVIDLVARPGCRLEEELREVETPGLGAFDQLRLVEHLALADHLVELAIAERRHQFANFFGDEEEVVGDMLGLTDEALAQHRVLRGAADRAGVEMALAHHDAAGRDQRRGGEAEFVRAEQGADHDVTSCAQAAVDLHGDARAQPVEHQRLMRFGEPDLPGRTRVLD